MSDKGREVAPHVRCVPPPTPERQLFMTLGWALGRSFCVQLCDFDVLPTILVTRRP